MFWSTWAMSCGSVALAPEMSKNLRLFTDGAWHSWAPAPPQFVCSTIRMSCDCQTRSSRDDSPGLAVSGGPITSTTSGSAGSEMSTIAMPEASSPSS